MGETWRPIPGFPGYDASDHGRVRSYLKRGRDEGQRITWEIAPEPQRLLTTRNLAAGYPSVTLPKGNGARRPYTVHELVMLAFVGPRPEGLVVRHNDGDPMNNCLDNLRYDTREANVADMITHAPEGKPSHQYKLSLTEVAEIRERLAAGNITGVALAHEYGVSKTLISMIKLGKARRKL